MPARLARKPAGHDQRLSMAKHRPESLLLTVADIGCLLNLGATAVCDRDHLLKPARLGLKAREHRRYSWPMYLAYRALTTA